MFVSLFRKGGRPRQGVYLIIGFLSLAFIFYQQSLYFVALAQEGEGSGATSAVSEEVQKAVESDLTVSPEAAKELAIDLPAELDLPNYDPIIPDNTVGKILYPLKEVAWDVQEGLYQTFASDASYSELVSNHANKELVAAAKLYGADSKAGSAVVNILGEYRDDLKAAQETILKVKDQDPVLAKRLSAGMAEDHLFIAPKVLGSMQDALLASDPGVVPSLVAIKNQVLVSAGTAIVNAADNEREVANALGTIAEKRQATPFSGITNAEVLSLTKEQLGDSVSVAISEAFGQVIGEQLQTVEENLKNLPAPEEIKAKSFEKYVVQLPGQSLERMKVIDQFKSGTELPPVMIAKMQEMKAKLAATIGAKIQQVVQEEVRSAVSQALLEFKNPGVNEFKILNEFKDLVPQEEIRQEIVKNHEAQVQKFLDRFGDDTNAGQVTEEFQGLMKKVESGQITPDANFFKTLEDLKGRLNPEQQRFIEEMESTGRREMVDRLQNDQNFPERFATFNPADLQVFDKIRESGFGPQFGSPPGFDFEAKFRQIEERQAENFGQFLELQNRPEDVAAIREQFTTAVPSEIRQRFEQDYHFGPEAFAKQEGLAREKEEFFRQKFEEMQKEFEAKFGPPSGPPSEHQPTSFPGQFPGSFPGGQGFGGEGGAAQPHGSSEKGACPEGMVFGQFGCEFKYEKPPTAGPNCPPGFAVSPFGCQREGGKSFPTPPGEGPPSGFDPAAACVQRGGTWMGSTCQFSGPRGPLPPEQKPEFQSGDNHGLPSTEPFMPPPGSNQPPLPPSNFVPPPGGFNPPPGGVFPQPVEGFSFTAPPPQEFPSSGTFTPPPSGGETSAPPPPSPAVQGVFYSTSDRLFGIFEFLSVFDF